jgi:hypothetical protein
MLRNDALSSARLALRYPWRSRIFFQIWWSWGVHQLILMGPWVALSLAYCIRVSVQHRISRNQQITNITNITNTPIYRHISITEYLQATCNRDSRITQGIMQSVPYREDAAVLHQPNLFLGPLISNIEDSGRSWLHKDRIFRARE